MRVLVADDNPINIIVVEEFLHRWEIEVDSVGNGEEALEMVWANVGKYDLVLMDLQMPVMDGFQASLSIRSNPDPYFQELPIIALTAAASEDIHEQAEAHKINGYLSKPFNPKDLFDLLQTYYPSPKSIITPFP